MIRKWTPQKRAAIVTYAQQYGVSAASKKFGANSSLIYKWRALSTPPTNGASKNPQGKKHKPAKRRQIADAQKRIILRYAKETSSEEAAERFGVGRSTIAYWRKKGFRAAMTSKTKAKLAHTRTVTTTSTRVQPKAGGVLGDRRGDLHEILKLRQEVTQLVEENEKLKSIVLTQVLENHATA